LKRVCQKKDECEELLGLEEEPEDKRISLDEEEYYLDKIDELEKELEDMTIKRNENYNLYIRKCKELEQAILDKEEWMRAHAVQSKKLERYRAFQKEVKRILNFDCQSMEKLADLYYLEEEFEGEK
jgi:hypothetical protein